MKSTPKLLHRIQEVTSLKSHVDYVVTEYGIAKLFGKTLAERNEEMIKIAHPKFRDKLRRAQKEVDKWT